MTAVAASVQRVSHRYGRTVALDNVTLEIPAQCMVGLIGPDGVGKSTLLALISGVRRIQEGEVFALNGDMRDASHRRFSLPRIAYMPQGLGRNLYPTLTVFENLDFFGRLFDQPKSEREWRINELLAATGLDPFADRPAGKLSGGMKQKLSLCCSLIHDPDLLILDEPANGLDPLGIIATRDLLRRLREQGKTIFLSSHLLGELEQVADWLVMLHQGKALYNGPARAFLEQHPGVSFEERFLALLKGEHQ